MILMRGGLRLGIIKQREICLCSNRRVSLSAMIRLLICDLEVTSSNTENNLSAAYGGKAAYIYPPQAAPGISLDDLMS